MTIINKIIDGKMYARKLLEEIYPLSKGFLDNFNRKPSLLLFKLEIIQLVKYMLKIKS